MVYALVDGGNGVGGNGTSVKYLYMVWDTMLELPTIIFTGTHALLLCMLCLLLCVIVVYRTVRIRAVYKLLAHTAHARFLMPRFSSRLLSIKAFCSRTIVSLLLVSHSVGHNGVTRKRLWHNKAEML